MPQGPERGSWEHHAGLGKHIGGRLASPGLGVASSFWLFGVKITVCNFNSSRLQ